MSSLAEKLAEQAMEEARKRGPEWVEKLVEEGKNLIPGHPGDPYHDELAAGLDWLAENKDDAADLGLKGLQSFAAFVAVGDTDNARLVFLAHGAGWDDLHNAVDVAADRTEQAARDKERAIGFAKAMGKKIARALLPILLAINPFKIPGL